MAFFALSVWRHSYIKFFFVKRWKEIPFIGKLNSALPRGGFCITNDWPISRVGGAWKRGEAIWEVWVTQNLNLTHTVGVSQICGIYNLHMVWREICKIHSRWQKNSLLPNTLLWTNLIFHFLSFLLSLFVPKNMVTAVRFKLWNFCIWISYFFFHNSLNPRVFSF